MQAGDQPDGVHMIIEHVDGRAAAREAQRPTG
jgi:hypothetical protein